LRGQELSPRRSGAAWRRINTSGGQDLHTVDAAIW
jgi:hypothetical protein